MMKRAITILLLICAGIANLSAQPIPLSDESEVVLLTCAPGREVYANFGHTAIRIYDPQQAIDLVFNYGIFDFETEGFYIKFIHGETYYMLGAQSAYSFFMQYEHEKRSVYSQVLNLTLDQRQAIWQALWENYRVENRYYLYNFVFDNCATRPYYLIEQALGDSIHSTYQGYKGTSFRKAIRHYTGAETWANFGINLLFGHKANKPMTNSERLFLPEELMFYLSEATLADGSKLVKEEMIRPFYRTSTPWHSTWYFGLALLTFILATISYYDRQHNKLSKWIDIILIIIYVILLLIVGFLTFFSLHPLVGFGWRLLIIPVIHLCTRLIYILR